MRKKFGATISISIFAIFFITGLTALNVLAADILNGPYYGPEQTQSVAPQPTPGITTPTPGRTTPDNLTLPNPLGEGNNDIIQIINNILNYLIYISIPILSFMILWGGFQILTARADPEKIKNGRATIMWSVIGFAIILISKGIALLLLNILNG